MIFLLKCLSGFVIGWHFGGAAGKGKVGYGLGLALTVALTLILCFAIDYIGTL